METRLGRAGVRVRGVVSASALTLVLYSILALGALPANAAPTANTVSVSGATMTFTAGDEQTNTLSIGGSGTNYTVTDQSGVTAGTGCTQTNATQAACNATLTLVVVTLDGELDALNDQFTSTRAVAFDVDGGGGNDTITTGPAGDTIDGGAGNDTLSGGTTIGTGGDTIAGSGGTDTVSYSTRSGDVSVSLDGVANDGQAGELDNVGTDVENITTGSGDDALVGSSGVNTLIAGTRRRHPRRRNGWRRAHGRFRHRHGDVRVARRQRDRGHRRRRR